MTTIGEVRQVFANYGLAEKANKFIKESHRDGQWYLPNGVKMTKPLTIAEKYAKNLRNKIDSDEGKGGNQTATSEAPPNLTTDNRQQQQVNPRVEEQKSSKIDLFILEATKSGLNQKEAEMIAYELEAVGWVDEKNRKITSVQAYAKFRALSQF